MRGFVVIAALLAALPGHAHAGSLAAAGWHASADRTTGAPSLLWGGTPAPGAVADAAIAERVARDFLAAHGAELAPGADFALVANQLDGDLRTVAFAQLAHGLPVLGGHIGFVFGHDRLFAIMSTAFPGVTVAQPRVRARGVTLRAILPIAGPSGIAYQPVDIVEQAARGGSERWQVYIGADGTVLGRKSLVMTDAATLQYTAGVRYAAGTRAPFPAPYAAITVNSAATATAADGTFMWTGTSPASVVPSVSGTYVRVINQSGAAATTTLSAQPGSSAVWDLASDALGDAQLSAYIYANTAKAQARRIDPGLAAWLDGQLAVYVNETFSSCNAYSTGDDIHFFAGTPSQCENTARIADVVYHEFGHSVHKQTVITGIGDWETALSEGLADFFAADMVDDSGLGRGFLLTNEPLREIDPVGAEATYPQDVSTTDPHVTGLIISGALWDLRKQLIAKKGMAAGLAAAEHILVGVMARAPHIPGSYMAALIADDDDANLANGTPNVCAINAAFAAHGLLQDLGAITLGPVSGEGLALAVRVDGAASCGRVTSMIVSWQSSTGATGSFPLTEQDTGFTGEFPAQPDGSVLTYSIAATLDDGSLHTLPDNPADPVYQRFIGPTRVVWCDMFDEYPTWKVGAAHAMWQWDTPRGLPDPSTAHTGTHVFGTTVTGDGLYSSDDYTYAETPVVDLSGLTTAHLQYWRWLTVENGKNDDAFIALRPSPLTETNHVTDLWHNLADGKTSHIDREWGFHDIDLAPYTQLGPMNLRWTLKSNGATELGGWTIDDVCVVTTDESVCGDNEISGTEQCDDGNRTDGDGCSKACTIEDGGCCSASPNPLGPVLLATLLGLRLRRRRVDPSA